MRALVSPVVVREARIREWVDASVVVEERVATLEWICNNSESLLSAAVEQLLELRDSWAQRDESTEAAISRLNRVYEDCCTTSEDCVRPM